MSKKQASPKFQIGDRVAEKPKPRAIYAKTAATIERIKPYTVQRYGTVLILCIKAPRVKPLCLTSRLYGMVRKHQSPMHSPAFV
jgi:hypothetical protein